MMTLGIGRDSCGHLLVLLLMAWGSVWLGGCTGPLPGDASAETQPLPGDDDPADAMDPVAPPVEADPSVEQPVPDAPSEPEQFLLTVATSGGGIVTPGSGSFESDERVTLSASADEGWRFDGWIGSVVSSNNPLILNIEAAVNVTAVFIRQFMLAVEVSGDGTVEIEPSGGLYDDGTIVSVTAIPGAGQQFARWEGDLNGTNAIEEIVVDADKRIGAVFAAQSSGGNLPPPPPTVETEILTVAISGNGGVAVAPTGSSVVGQDGVDWQLPLDSAVMLTPIDNPNACFVRWGGDIRSIESTLEFTLTRETFVLAIFADPDDPALAPMLDTSETHTTEQAVTVSGNVQSCLGDRVTEVEVAGPTGVSRVPVLDAAFSADVSLRSNSTNHILFTAISESGVRGAPAPLAITQDGLAPALFIDFPPDGAELTNESIDVAGRVSDILSGFMGLTVLVSGIPAIVDVGIGSNGTFERAAVPLAIGENTIEVVATDELGNSVARSSTVTRVEVPEFTPRLSIVSGLGQIARIFDPLAEPIVVRVDRRDGTPFANKTVTFRVTRSDGRLFADFDTIGDGSMMFQTQTDAAGMARAFWRMGADAGCGNNRVEVTSTSIAGTTFFCASATPAPPVQINIGTGSNQRGEAGAPASEPLRVWVNDRCNGVSDVPVTFTVTQGGGRVDNRRSVTVLTGETGHAEVSFVLGPDRGNNVVAADFVGNLAAAARFTVYGVQRKNDLPTRISGVVLNNNDQPIEGAICSLTVGSIAVPAVLSDVDGMFLFDDIPGGGASVLHINGLTATRVGGEQGRDIPKGSFPALVFHPIIVPNAANALSTPVMLPPLNPNNARVFDNTLDVELTVEGVEGIKMTVRAGSMTRADGSVPSVSDSATIALNQVFADKIPMPMPDGAAPPFAWTLQPGGAKFDPPVEITYPNMSGLPAGSIAYFLSFNHATMRFEIVATGSVTSDGSCIESDPGAGISTAGWGCNCPPYSVTGDCCDCGPCQDCNDGECVPRDCGTCRECVNDSCQTIDCGECQVCDGGSCRSECSEDERCAFGGCTKTCDIDNDCDDGDPCIENSCLFGFFAEVGVCFDVIRDCSCPTATEGDICQRSQGGTGICAGSACVECRNDADCEEGKTCPFGGALGCVEVCQSDNECDDGDECTDDQCVFGVLPNDGVCDSRITDCSCATVQDGDQCKKSAGGLGVCDGASCVECRSDADCEGGKICPFGGALGCVEVCQLDNECDDGDECTDDQCVFGVLPNDGVCNSRITDCSCATVQDGDPCKRSAGGFGVCDGASCVECRSDADCEGGKICPFGGALGCVEVCQSDNECDDGDECTDDQCVFGVLPNDGVCNSRITDCSCATVQNGDRCTRSAGGIGFCDGASCVECRNEADCMGDDTCRNGVCVVSCAALPDNAVCTLPPGQEPDCGFSWCQSGVCVANHDDCTVLSDQCNVGTCDASIGQCVPIPITPTPSGCP